MILFAWAEAMQKVQREVNYMDGYKKDHRLSQRILESLERRQIYHRVKGISDPNVTNSQNPGNTCPVHARCKGNYDKIKGSKNQVKAKWKPEFVKKKFEKGPKLAALENELLTLVQTKCLVEMLDIM